MEIKREKSVRRLLARLDLLTIRAAEKRCCNEFRIFLRRTNLTNTPITTRMVFERAYNFFRHPLWGLQCRAHVMKLLGSMKYCHLLQFLQNTAKVRLNIIELRS